MSNNINNNLTGIAKRYSKALLDAALEKELLEQTEKDIKSFYEMYVSSPELQRVLCAPTIKTDEKKAIIEELTQSFGNKYIKEFLFLLAQENRFNAFETIYYCFNEELNREKNITKVEIKSVVELDEDQKERLTKKLCERLGATIKPEYLTTPEIIGGLVISYEDKTIDLSIKSKLEDLKKQLT